MFEIPCQTQMILSSHNRIQDCEVPLIKPYSQKHNSGFDYTVVTAKN